MGRCRAKGRRVILLVILDFDFIDECGGRRVGGAWFSPDCTYFSKALGGKPHRDRNKARRRRGLAGVIVKCAVQVRPRVLFMENVEEFAFWCPLDEDGKPDITKLGQSFYRWVARLRNLGYVVEWRVLRGCDFGAPTTRKRLYVIARCDGRRIVWPAATHGPTLSKKYRTAAECIDFNIPVPSIFLTPEEARAWGKAHGIATPKRPLAGPTMRRIARGIDRFVIRAAEPFIISVRHQDDSHAHSTHEPLRTIPASDREFALVTPFIAKHFGERVGSAIDEPLHTVMANGVHHALVAPTLIQVGYGERQGQAPRSLDLHAPLGTIVGGGMKHALVAAFLAKHNGGHEATGQQLLKPIDTIVTADQKALVTSHLLKLYGTCQDGAPVTDPMPVVTAHGNHLAEVRAFLVKYYGAEKDGQSLQIPLGTVVTKDRFALVTVMIGGEPYVIVDIVMRMLTPRELYLAQGFPREYVIDATVETPFRPAGPLTKKAQTRLVGNSVVPHVAAALVEANFAWRDEEAVA